MRPPLKVGGYRPRAASWTTTAIFVAVVGTHLFAPLIWPLAAPSAASVTREAPYIAALALLATWLLGIATWIDSNRETWPLGLVAVAVVANVVIRDLFNITLGAELNYVIPFVVGLGAGGPMGLLVGATSCVLSQFWLDQIGTPIATQMLVWGLAGLVGGMLRPLGPRLSCVVAPAAGVGFGLVAGLLLNAVSWPIDPEARPGFVPIVPFPVNFAALVRYGLDTSWGVDLLRGLMTGAGLAVVGYPLSRALRHALRPPPVDESPPMPDPRDPRPAAVARRARSRTTDTMWKEHHG